MSSPSVCRACRTATEGRWGWARWNFRISLSDVDVTRSFRFIHDGLIRAHRRLKRAGSRLRKYPDGSEGRRQSSRPENGESDREEAIGAVARSKPPTLHVWGSRLSGGPQAT